MFKPAISIIVPVYNADKFLKKCLESIQNQSFTNFEVILINDGSTDNSLNICTQFSISDSRFKVYTQINAGVSLARNHGIKIANGDYICFVDSDDTVDEYYLETMYNNIVQYDADISISKLYRNQKEKSRCSNTLYIWSSDKALIEFLKIHRFEGVPSCKLYKRNIFKNIYFKEKIKIGEDQIFLIECLLQAQTVVFQDKATYQYYIRPGSAMNSIVDARYWDEVFRAKWLKESVVPLIPQMKDLIDTAAINIYIGLVFLDMKVHTKESNLIAQSVYSEICSYNNLVFLHNSTIYDFLKFILVKYFNSVAKALIWLKRLEI